MSASHPGLSVWTRPRQRARPALNRERIVAEAIALLDAEGIAALSMRTLGTRLNAGATSMYRHVASREELIELAVDEVYGDIEVPVIEGVDQWRPAVIVCAESYRRMILCHPWIAEALPGAGLAHLGPNMLRLNESLFTVFAIAEFPIAEAHLAISTVLGYVVGVCLGEASWLTLVARSGQDEQSCAASMLPVLERIAREHPRIGESIAARGKSSVVEARDAKFRFGLERILDGLETRLPGWSA
ncbi:TetR/AcrR family transcriptional regulator [Nocardia sp. NBC_01503]|uniref:TetR/AcrR family transcriptional regulator C-terminal domain-containing protein n=1 Tax=Nocardia sp. NBC_01503 TaxID=2975997 RepID=UPI002E7B7F3D|nr:TetR/AcrR family transcriptional regulator C-terminal domain-containing protein [Nocardia sp. NBC_01503]WTL29650.1 TetR/AcrR family transcriptional regulator [Nocardia sp. NBC_01503]